MKSLFNKLVPKSSNREGNEERLSIFSIGLRSNKNKRSKDESPETPSEKEHMKKSKHKDEIQIIKPLISSAPTTSNDINCSQTSKKSTWVGETNKHDLLTRMSDVVKDLNTQLTNDTGHPWLPPPRVKSSRRSNDFDMDDRGRESSLSSKNKTFFAALRDEEIKEKKRKQEELAKMSIEERQRLEQEQEEAKNHEKSKLNHYSKLGACYVPKTGALHSNPLSRTSLQSRPSASSKSNRNNVFSSYGGSGSGGEGGGYNDFSSEAVPGGVGGGGYEDGLNKDRDTMNTSYSSVHPEYVATQ